MTTYFISRHPGAIEWSRRQGLRVDSFVTHLAPIIVAPGDIVIGSLPVNLAAEVCLRKAKYLHLSLALPPALRGKELTADEMDDLGAHVEAFEVSLIDMRFI